MHFVQKFLVLFLVFLYLYFFLTGTQPPPSKCSLEARPNRYCSLSLRKNILKELVEFLIMWAEKLQWIASQNVTTCNFYVVCVHICMWVFLFFGGVSFSGSYVFRYEPPLLDSIRRMQNICVCVTNIAVALPMHPYSRIQGLLSDLLPVLC